MGPTKNHSQSWLVYGIGFDPQTPPGEPHMSFMTPPVWDGQPPWKHGQSKNSIDHVHNVHDFHHMFIIFLSSSIIIHHNPHPQNIVQKYIYNSNPYSSSNLSSAHPHPQKHQKDCLRRTASTSQHPSIPARGTEVACSMLSIFCRNFNLCCFCCCWMPLDGLVKEENKPRG